ncbi:hypothetical protein VC83_05664 [Pseudogymnoascus destructans]|uniref:Uncharacterized protein n=2 Tax=Pseudogymnoascus destructans TaxID=655981 RepID=L8G4N1_PSED2|nr:uncharacterized protein VC83_05664 [Pseudogymnoascus destructans]ELR06946.1 hypothetical protein GMDG_08180 [Pseudogymnoascus destructans 20631-21]OAF57819.1 hypothetical protein VC83_05664 [Pseudogymnoascus destructans]
MATNTPPREADAGSLTDSTYEFVDDDIESRDGNATESVASADYCRPDDVTSLADTENSFDDTESEKSHATGGIPGLDRNNEEADAQEIGQSAESFLQTTTGTSDQPILFEEPQAHRGPIIASLPMKDLSEDEIKAITPYLKLRGNRMPDRISASLGQTMMSTRILTTVVPLRILYVGSRGAMHDIIRKIGSAVAAYMDNDPLSNSSSATFYNVIPVSDFGSHHAPEIELMPSSGWNFQVEECLKAVNFGAESSQGKEGILELTLNKNTYRSMPQNGEFHVQPKWELPHLSIFYCSENDTEEMRETRIAASEFTSRHNIARIFITHKPMLEKPLEWEIPLGHHPIHLSLEAMFSSSMPRGTVHLRLPIDLASFMSIDARQMNKNLAYITFRAMTEQGETSEAASTSRSKVRQAPKTSPAVKGLTSVKATNSRNVSKFLTGLGWRDLVPVGLLITGILASIFANFYSFKPIPANLVSINGNLTPTHPSPVTVITSMTTTESAVIGGGASYTSRVQTKTITKMIDVVEVLSSSTSISLVQSKDVGAVAEPYDGQKMVCTAERLGDQEVLIRIPSATKLSWLAKEAMLVNVTRNNETVDIERVYSSHYGIVLHFAHHEAHGNLRIAVVTTKHPKVNKTFHIDLGSSWTRGFHETLDKLCQRVYDDVLPRDFNLDETLTRIDEWRNQAVLHTQFVAHIGRQQAEVQGARAAEAGRELATQAITTGLELADRVREPLGAALLKAQVDSRAQWLRLTGRVDEAKEYQRKASEAGVSTGKCSQSTCGWLGRRVTKEEVKEKEKPKDKVEPLRDSLKEHKERMKKETEARKVVFKARIAEKKKETKARRDVLKERKANRKTCSKKRKARRSKR